MPLSSPVLALATGLPMKRLYQWFNRILPFGTIFTRTFGHGNASFAMKSRSILLKTIAYKWSGGVTVRLPKIQSC